jgi:hypothetical protein
MKTLLFLTLLSLPVFSQTQEQLAIYLPAGKQMALESYLAQGGGMLMKGGSGKPGFRYQEGPIRGLTKDQAISKFETVWARASGETKKMYAKRAIESGRNSDVNAHLREIAEAESGGSSKTADQNARLIEESKRRREQQEVERRLREIERKQPR